MVIVTALVLAVVIDEQLNKFSKIVEYRYICIYIY